jgi:hypothetical protein
LLKRLTPPRDPVLDKKAAAAKSCARDTAQGKIRLKNRHHYAISKKLVDQALLGYSRAAVGALILIDAVWSGKF